MYHFTPNLNICVHYCCKKCQKPTFSFRLKNEILILTEAVIKKKNKNLEQQVHVMVKFFTL